MKSGEEVGVLRDTMDVKDKKDKKAIRHPQAWKAVTQTGPAATER